MYPDGLKYIPSLKLVPFYSPPGSSGNNPSKNSPIKTKFTGTFYQTIYCLKVLLERGDSYSKIMGMYTILLVHGELFSATVWGFTNSLVVRKGIVYSRNWNIRTTSFGLAGFMSPGSWRLNPPSTQIHIQWGKDTRSFLPHDALSGVFKIVSTFHGHSFPREDKDYSVYTKSNYEGYFSSTGPVRFRADRSGLISQVSLRMYCLAGGVLWNFRSVQRNTPTIRTSSALFRVYLFRNSIIVRMKFMLCASEYIYLCRLCALSMYVYR